MRRSAARRCARRIDLLAADAATRVIAIVSKPPADGGRAESPRACGARRKALRRAVPRRRSRRTELAGAYARPSRRCTTQPRRQSRCVKRLPVDRGVFAEADRRTRRNRSEHLRAVATLRAADSIRAARSASKRNCYGPHSACACSPTCRSTANRPSGDVPAHESHCAIDFGADEFTIGRPHPMIDMSTRIARLLRRRAILRWRRSSSMSCSDTAVIRIRRAHLHPPSRTQRPRPCVTAVNCP